MKITCDATGVAIDATPEVAEMLYGHGFSLIDAAPVRLKEIGNTDDLSDPVQVEEKEVSVDTPKGDPSEEASDQFNDWQVTKEFLKERAIADLRTFASDHKVELPTPANKGQIINAIVAALSE